jgi:hypothetical protein
LLEPRLARIAITPSGSTATPEVLIARNSAIALLATPGRVFSVSSSRMAFSPNGVAALPRPSTFAARFRTIAPIAGCSAGTSGKSLRMTGESARAIEAMKPASRSTA